MPEWSLVLILIVLGFILLLIEILVIPGFGIPGIVGLFFLTAASYIAYKRLDPLAGIATTIGSLIVLGVFIKLLPRSKTWRRLHLEATETKEKGFHSAKDELRDLIDKEGISITVLRPSGTALIDNKRVDVVTEGVFIQENARIKVIKVDGSRVLVRGAEE